MPELAAGSLTCIFCREANVSIIDTKLTCVAALRANVLLPLDSAYVFLIDAVVVSYIAMGSSGNIFFDIVAFG